MSPSPVQGRRGTGRSAAQELIGRSLSVRRACRPDRPPQRSPLLWMGTSLGLSSPTRPPPCPALRRADLLRGADLFGEHVGEGHVGKAVEPGKAVHGQLLRNLAREVGPAPLRVGASKIPYSPRPIRSANQDVVFGSASTIDCAATRSCSSSSYLPATASSVANKPRVVVVVIVESYLKPAPRTGQPA
jgi:hypothetical protein